MRLQKIRRKFDENSIIYPIIYFDDVIVSSLQDGVYGGSSGGVDRGSGGVSSGGGVTSSSSEGTLVLSGHDVSHGVIDVVGLLESKDLVEDVVLGDDLRVRK